MAPVERRGRVLGLYGLAVWGGLSVGPLTGELLLVAGGYTAVWLFAAAVPMLGALIASRVPDPYVPHHAESHPLIAPEAVGPGLAVALAAVGYAAVASFVILHLEDRGIGHGELVFGAFAAMIVVARLIAGDLPDRVGAAPVAVVAALAEAAGLLTIALAESLPVALIGGCAMGAAFSLVNPSLMLIALGRVTPAARGAAMGTYTAFFDAGVGLGAPLAGAAAALTDYEGAFVFAAVIAVASAVLSLTRLRERHMPAASPNVPSAR
jgi:MFS family permease